MYNKILNLILNLLKIRKVDIHLAVVMKNRQILIGS